MKVQIITSIFPLPWQPNREVFNRQQFLSLAQRCAVKVSVTVPWLVALKKRAQMRPYSDGDLNVRFRWYFFPPKLGRVLYPGFLLLASVPEFMRLRANRPDCILISWAYPDAVAGVMLARMLKVPVVIKVHGSDINMHCTYPARAAQVAWAMRQASAVVCVSRDLAAQIMRMGIPEEKLRVIYNGVDKTRFYPTDREQARAELALPAARRTILYIGNLKAEKGCVDLFHAFRNIAAQEPDADLHYIGTGVQHDRLVALAKDAGLADRVILHGSIAHSLLPRWINASNLVSLPSHSEGVPNVLLEAMACGVPVVATRVGGIPEVVAPVAGLTCEFGDLAAFGQALSDALQRTWDRHQIAETMKDFTWERSAHLLHQTLQDAAGNAAHPIKPLIRQADPEV